MSIRMMNDFTIFFAPTFSFCLIRHALYIDSQARRQPGWLQKAWIWLLCKTSIIWVVLDDGHKLSSKGAPANINPSLVQNHPEPWRDRRRNVWLHNRFENTWHVALVWIWFLTHPLETKWGFWENNHEQPWTSTWTFPLRNVFPVASFSFVQVVMCFWLQHPSFQPCHGLES